MTPSQILTDLVDALLDEAEFAAPDWDSFTVVANLTPTSGELSAFRYTADAGRMMQVTDLRTIDQFRELQEATTAPDGATWQVCILKLDRDSAQVAVKYVSPADAGQWEITPDNFAEMSERLRPQPADFA